MDQTLDILKSTLGDRYRLERQVGRGGMATVYLAHDLRHDRQVAIKVMSPDLAATIGAERFTREVKIAAKLSHPNILGVFDSGETQGLLYYVMPFVKGETLREKLGRERQLSIDESIQIICEVAEALEHAHSHGVVHRDIKPENILLQDGRALVADFGIARLAEAEAEKLTKTGMAVGTAQYMSPEQAAGEPTDARTDVYALGCLLFEMLAGQPPFTGSNAMAIMSQHALATVPEITAMRTSVPSELAGVIVRAMEKTPADRFQGMDDFRRAVLGEIPATTTSLPRYTARYRTATAATAAPNRRKVGMIAIAAAGIVAVGVGLVFAPKMASREVAPDAARLAVLYFEDESGGSLQHVADGLTVAVIDRLSDVSTLTVVSENGVRPMRGTAVPTDSVRRAFGVGSVVKGSVRREATRLLVSINLYDAASRARLAATSVTVDTAQLATLDDSVTAKIADFLTREIGTEVSLRTNRAQTTSNLAWTLYERAAKQRRDADSLLGIRDAGAARGALARADSLLSASQEADARWAKSRVARASVASLAAQLLAPRSAGQRAVIDSGLAHAEEALASQPNNADALDAKGRLQYLKYVYGLQVDPTVDRSLLLAAESTLKQATVIDRNHAGAWAALSNLYYSKPDIALAAAAAEEALRSDAWLSSANAILRRLFWTRHDRSEYSEARRHCDAGRRRFPADPFFTECRLWMYTTGTESADVDSAWAYQRRYVEQTAEASRPYAEKFSQILVAGALARAQLADSARAVLLRARADSRLDPGRELAGNEAVIRVILRDYDEAVNLIASYLAIHPDHKEGFVSRVSPWWVDLQTNPRFKALVGSPR